MKSSIPTCLHCGKPIDEPPTGRRVNPRRYHGACAEAAKREKDRARYARKKPCAT